MSLPELYILRHGETEANAEGRMQGGIDSPLTEKGLAQADKMAQLLADCGVSPTRFDLISSPQGRAMQTASPISKATGCPITEDARVAEIGMGLWAGLLLSEIATRWPAPVTPESSLQFYARAPEAESFDSLWARTSDFLSGLQRPAVIITHGFTSRFLRTQVLGRGMDRLSEVPDGQGVIFHFHAGKERVIK